MDNSHDYCQRLHVRFDHLVRHRNFSIDVFDNVSSIFVLMNDFDFDVDEMLTMNWTMSTKTKIVSEIANASVTMIETVTVTVILIESVNETESASVSENSMVNDWLVKESFVLMMMC